jgi:hypothetical protein
MPNKRRMLLRTTLLFPAILLASTDVTFNSPVGGSAVIVTPNQSLPARQSRKYMCQRRRAPCSSRRWLCVLL